MDLHLRIATWINLGLGVVATAGGLLGMLAGITLGLWHQDVEVFGWLFIFGLASAAPGIPWLVGGWGLLKGKEWGRMTLVVFSVLALFLFPAGTLLGGYTLWVLLNPETRRILAGGGDARDLALEPAYAAAIDQAESPRTLGADYVERPRTAG